jgi:hypothetical protein
MNMPPKKKENKIPEEGAKGKTLSKIYTLDVYLIGGPVSDEFDDQIIFRTIQIRGDQTLEDFHESIFKAFDRFDGHLYEFILGVGPDDRSAIYSLPMDIEVSGFEEMAGDVRTTFIESLGLEVDQAFGYRFDFGDNWLHQINVIAIENFPGKGRYPKIITKVGKSPSQYPDQDE